MGVVNGKIATGTLVNLEYARGQQLRADAADAWNRVNRDFKKRTGVNIDLTDSYRPYAVQVTLLKRNYDHKWRAGLTVRNGGIKYWDGRIWYKKPGYAVASTPGQSNHGWGIAVDAAGLGGFNGRYYAALAAVAGKHGWSNANGRAINEPWHWEYTAGNDKGKSKPVKPHHRRKTTARVNLRNAPGGGVVRVLEKGYTFTVLDGSGTKHGGLWWVKTTSGNWVASKYTKKVK